MSILDRAKNTLKDSPIRIVIYGKGGVGKSTFASQAPSPIFICGEDGLDNINTTAVTPSNWKELLDIVDEIVDSKYETVVIDSLDWLEPICFDHVCKVGDDKGPKDNIESFPYGKGFSYCINEWRQLLSRLERCRAKGKHVILIAHMVRKSVRNLTGEDYDSFVIKLQEKAAGLIREWVDVVGMAELEVVATKLNSHESVKGSATGRRLLRTAPSAAFDSKTRFALPDRLNLNWHEFYKSVRDASYTQIPKLKKDLDIYLNELNDAEVASKAMSFLAARGETVSALNEAINTVRKYIEVKVK